MTLREFNWCLIGFLAGCLVVWKVFLRQGNREFSLRAFRRAARYESLLETCAFFMGIDVDPLHIIFCTLRPAQALRFRYFLERVRIEFDIEHNMRKETHPEDLRREIQAKSLCWIAFLLDARPVRWAHTEQGKIALEIYDAELNDQAMLRLRLMDPDIREILREIAGGPFVLVWYTRAATSAARYKDFLEDWYKEFARKQKVGEFLRRKESLFPLDTERPPPPSTEAVREALSKKKLLLGTDSSSPEEETMEGTFIVPKIVRYRKN